MLGLVGSEANAKVGSAISRESKAHRIMERCPAFEDNLLSSCSSISNPGVPGAESTESGASKPDHCRHQWLS